MGTTSISRRGFLGGAVVAAAGMAATSMLATTGCSPSASNEVEEVAGAESGASSKFWNPTEQDSSWMDYTTDYSDIFQPIQVGPLSLKNRLIKGSAGSDTTNNDEKKLPEVSKCAIAYYTNIAKGGVAAIVLEADTLGHLGFAPNTAASRLATKDRDAQIAAGKVLADAVHEHDCKILYRFRAPGSGIVDTDVVGKTKEFLQEFFDSCGECALKLKEAGYDGCEIKAATTDISSQFLSLKNNTREDEFGPQSIENRARIMTEQVKSIKAKAGEDFAVFCVLNCCEENDARLGDNDGYLTFEECVLIAQEIEKAGVDLIEIRAGGGSIETSSWAPDNAHVGYMRHGMTAYGTRIDYDVHWGGIQDGSKSGVGAFLPAAEKLKQSLSVPVGTISADPRLAPDLMNNAVRDGKVDVLVINRCLQADPELPNKLKEGRRDEVAPCSRCLHCHTAGLTPKTAERCRVNASLQVAYRKTMPEGYEPLPAEMKKRVAVVGGGPAGMEAARIAAQRGHDVTLYEKQGSLGGLLKVAHVYKGAHEQLADLVAYLAKQQEVCGVDVRLETEVTAESLSAEGFDAVIVAVGGKRRALPLASSETVNVVGFDELMTAEIGERVVILGAGAQAIDVCQFLLAQGKSVQMVNPGLKEDIDKEQSLWFRAYLLPDLYAFGVKIWSQAAVKGLTEGGLAIETAYDSMERTLACDTVIDVWDMEVNDALAKELEGACEVVAVGDCSAPWNIQSAISGGNLAARRL